MPTQLSSCNALTRHAAAYWDDSASRLAADKENVTAKPNKAASVPILFNNVKFRLSKVMKILLM